MSTLDHCPTKQPDQTPQRDRERSAASGKVYWRSLDDLADSRPFRDFLEREFPAHASELLAGSRREFLKVMGASLALAGAATIPGCRRPDHKILPYNAKPEEIIHGKALFYASALALPGGGAAGILAETFDGRPTKLEGNPLHDHNNGALDARGQAHVLDLYDPDRTPEIAERLAQEQGVELEVRSWAAFDDFAPEHFARYDATNGQGLVFVADKLSSPSRDVLRDRVLERWPEATWLSYQPADGDASLEGTRIALGHPHHVQPMLEGSKVILSLASDFLGVDGDVRTIRGFARSRIREGDDPQHAAAETVMNRLYVVESNMTITGGQADHRLPARPAQAAAVAVAIASAVLAELPAGSGATSLRAALDGVRRDVELPELPMTEAFVEHCAKDLAAHRGESAVLVGPEQPAAVHALGVAMNAALRNIDATIALRPLDGPSRQLDADLGRSSAAALRTLRRRIDQGAVSTLVTIGCNPAYDGPADLRLAEAIADVETTIHLGQYDETAAASTWVLRRAHALESWGDCIDWDGAYSIQQPMIAPLHEGRSDVELLGTILGDGSDGYEILRRTIWRRFELPGAFDPENPRFASQWRRALHDGFWPGSKAAYATIPQNSQIRWSEIAAALREAAPRMRSAEGIDLVFTEHPFVGDGRFANNGWMQELPHPVTKISWANPALMNMATAKRLGLKTGRHLVARQYHHTQVVRIAVGDRSIEIPIWIQPGLPDDTVILHLGYGRRVGGRIAQGTGVDVTPLRSTTSMRVATGATIEPARNASPQLIPCTQDHWSMEGRAILREADLPAWRTHGDLLAGPNRKFEPGEGDEDETPPGHEHGGKHDRDYVVKDYYGNIRDDLTFAGRFGMEGHTPANESIYTQEQQHRYVATNPETHEPVLDAAGRPLPRKGEWGRIIQQWGMSIDLTKCVGCGTCTVACQAENNIPIVGPKEVAKGREMHWIRIDRYYAGSVRDPLEDASPDMMQMPVTCLHCENAPCEVVCPVNATVHSEEGMNDMAYNRCIGTRYCSNNCPYKVRRFNWFDYATKQYKGGFGQIAEGTPDALMPKNENLMPPRLRQERLEVATMQHNPHVTVRSRGVMEKCTYCVQRVNAARVESRLHDLDIIPDGFFQTACQQACPAEAIVFGDIYDYRSNGGAGSAVYRERRSQRTYGLLAYLNTRPRTTYKMRIRNPNPALVDEERRHRWEDPFHHGHHDDAGHEHEGHDGHDEHASGRIMSLPIIEMHGVAPA